MAVRLLPRELSAEAVQRSRRSIIAASASHPAFVRVLDSGETSDGRSFMVMELAEGQVVDMDGYQMASTGWSNPTRASSSTRS